MVSFGCICVEKSYIPNIYQHNLSMVRLVRHGQSTSDVENRYGWLYNDELTELWFEQAVSLADDFRDYAISVIYTSPLIRAQQTAEIIGQRLGVDVMIYDDFREKNHYGILSGMIKLDAQKRYPDLVEKVSRYDGLVMGAENYSAFNFRVCDAFDDVQKDDRALIVTHGWPIRCIARELLWHGEIASLADCAYLEIHRWESGVYTIGRMKGIEFAKQ